MKVLCAYMCMYVHICMSMYVNAHIRAYINVYVHICTTTYIYVQIYVPLLTINEPDMFLYGHALTILTDQQQFGIALVQQQFGMYHCTSSNLLPCSITCSTMYHYTLIYTDVYYYVPLRMDMYPYALHHISGHVVASYQHNETASITTDLNVQTHTNTNVYVLIHTKTYQRETKIVHE